MNNIKVTVELCAEDRARLDGILEALKQPMKVADVAPVKAEEAPVKVEEAPVKVEEAPVQEAVEAPQTEAVEEPKEEKAKVEKPAEIETEKPEAAPAPTVSPADVRALVQKLVAPGTGKRDATKEIVTRYARNVSDIPADKLTEVYEKLKALEAEA